MGGSLPLKLEGEVKTGGTPSQVGLLGGMWFFFFTIFASLCYTEERAFRQNYRRLYCFREHNN